MWSPTLLISVLLAAVPEALSEPGILAPGTVTGYVNESAEIHCHYKVLFSRHTKYWCRGPVYDMCKIVVKTTSPRERGRSSITDRSGDQVFTVRMSDLQWDDQGQYWCVIAKRGRNIFSGVYLYVRAPVPEGGSKTQTTSCGVWMVLRWILFGIMLISFVAVTVCPSATCHLRCTLTPHI